MTKAHLTPDLLVSYADGSLSEGLSLLAASHLTFCPACRAGVARIEAVGGAILCESAEVEPAPQCLAGALALLDTDDDADADAPPPAEDAGSCLPVPLRQRLGCRTTDINWRFLLPGLSEYRLDGFEDEEVSLLRARPGVRIFPHTHSDREATLVLTGEMRDGDRVFSRGDVALADERDAHRPEIIGDQVCICLVVLSGRMKFTGPVGRALNFLKR